MPPPPPSSDTARKITILAGAATMSMVLGVSSIMPLLPSLAENYDVPLYVASLLITAFTLPGILFTPVAGMLADLYGRKAVLIPSLLIFSLAGGACALAPNFETLVACRFLQGIGAAPLGVLNTTLLGDSFSGPARSKMIGYNMLLLNICTALYPAIGGYLGQIDMHLPFLLPLLTLPVIFIAIRTPMAFTPERTTLATYCKNMGATLTSPAISGMLIVTLLSFALLYGPIITNLPILAHIKFSSTPGEIGTVMMLYSVGSGLVASQIGKLSTRFSARNMLLTSQLCYIAGLILIPQMPSFQWIIFPALLYGAGQGLNIPNVQVALMNNAGDQQRAAVMAVNGMLLRIGQTISPLCFSTLAVWQGVNAPYYWAIILPVALALLVYRFVPNQVE